LLLDDRTVRTLPDPVAPCRTEILDYDRRNLLLYAELLDAEADGIGWEAGAFTVLGLDAGSDATKLCWDSHLARARWIVNEGLGAAIAAFGKRSLKG
jgi:hypothetical protein